MEKIGLLSPGRPSQFLGRYKYILMVKIAEDWSFESRNASNLEEEHLELVLF